MDLYRIVRDISLAQVVAYILSTQITLPTFARHNPPIVVALTLVTGLSYLVTQHLTTTLYTTIETRSRAPAWADPAGLWYMGLVFLCMIYFVALMGTGVLVAELIGVVFIEQGRLLVFFATVMFVTIIYGYYTIHVELRRLSALIKA